MAKPQWRNYDDIPVRDDDIRLKAFGVTIEASGKVVILIILVCALIGFGFVHDWRTDEKHDTLAEGFAVMTCVLTLNDAQRVEFRTQGSYCGDESIYYRIRKQVRPEAK